MSKVRLTKEQKKNLKEWIKRVYSELDDSEEVPVIVEEIFFQGYQRAAEDLEVKTKIDLKKKILSFMKENL